VRVDSVEPTLLNFFNSLRRHGSIWLFLAIVLPTAASGQAPQRPTSQPAMDAFALPVAPVVDGEVLGDPAWEGATPATGFWQIRPDDGAPATQRTEVFVGYSAAALHIGVIAYDENPDAIIVTDSRRDSSLDDTDAFLVVIDGQLDRQNGFIFGTNAAGIEYDGQVTSEGAGGAFGGGGFNRNWDATWVVQSKIGRHGWSAEFEIPFRTLRFGREDRQDWGINFQRNIRRNNEVAFWAPLERNRPDPRVGRRNIARYRAAGAAQPAVYAVRAR